MDTKQDRFCPERPPIIFGTSALGNLYRDIPYKEKLEIAEQWFNSVPVPVILDSAGKYGAGFALENIGRVLHDIGVSPQEVAISNKLGWKRVPLTGPEPTFEPGVWIGIGHDAKQVFSRNGILECWEQGNELLDGYEARIVSCHDPDEYLAASADAEDRKRRLDRILESYDVLFELKKKGYVDAVGVGAKDWRVIQELTALKKLDWAMFACSFTVYTHPAALRTFMLALTREGTVLINSAVFHAGFLTGGKFFDYRIPDPKQEPELFQWRDRFFEICREFKVPPALACIEFGLHAEPISWIALNTTQASRVRENVEALSFRAPEAFWQRMKEEGLIQIVPRIPWESQTE
jgi:D-threo-aldose 1-dehydrogenase